LDRNIARPVCYSTRSFLSRRALLAWAAGLALAWPVFAATAGVAGLDPGLLARARKVHQRAIVIDSHIDTPLSVVHQGIDLGVRQTGTDVDLIRMKEGGVDAAFFAVFIPNQDDDKQPFLKALKIIDQMYLQVERNAALCEMAFSSGDVRRIEHAGKRAVLLGLENGSPIEDDLGLLRHLHRLGVRYVTLTHNSNNRICDSATAAEPKWNGLSPFGREVVAEMNRLGMMIDVSHISEAAFWQVLECSQAPVIASHSCCRALCDVPRNLSDAQIKALAARGGVIQVNFYGAFLSAEYARQENETRQRLAPVRQQLKEQYKDNRSEYIRRVMELMEAEGPKPPSLDVLIDHLDHVVRLVGVDHVGLGSDFDGASGYPAGLEDVTGFPLITYHLLKRGYREDDVVKILGGNLLRVFEANERLARRRP